MIDAGTLAYDFDEEARGFGEPPRQAAPPLAPLSKLALALVALGLLWLVVQVAGGGLAGTWPGFLGSFGLLSAGAALHFWVTLAGTVPGIKHDGVWFKGLLARGDSRRSHPITCRRSRSG